MLKFDFLEKRYVRFIFLALSAMLTGICVCYPDLGILQWVSLIPAALVIFSVADTCKNRLRSVYLYGLFFYMCYFVTVWHWFFVMYPLEFTGMDAGTALLVVLAAVLGIPLVQSSMFAFVLVIFCKLARGETAKRIPFLKPFLFAALWVVFEWTQTLFWFGVPWGRLAIGQTKLLVTLQSSSVLGSYFVSFLIVAVNSLVAAALLYVSLRKLCALTCAGLFTLNFAFGAVMMLPKKQNEQVTVAAIQGNISSVDKWNSSPQKAYDTYKRLTREAAESGAQIVVWPESVLLSYSYSTEQVLANLAKENEIVLVVGALVTDEEGQKNCMITFYPDGTVAQESYKKRHLVPFGEYMPWRDFLTAILPFLSEISILGRDLIPGEEASPIDTEYGKMGALVCFDSIYETLALDSAKSGAELIIIGTNDSWFFDSAGVWMHEAQAKMRAIETGKYVVRAANTGVSAIITPQGRVEGELEPLVEGYVIGDVSFVENKTVYTYIGNLWVWLSIGFAAFVAGADITLKILGKKKLKQ